MKLFNGREWELNCPVGSCAGGEQPDYLWANTASQASLDWIASEIHVSLGGSTIITFQAWIYIFGDPWLPSSQEQRFESSARLDQRFSVPATLN